MPIGFAITTCSHSGNSNGPNGAVVVNPSAQYRNAGRVLVTSHLHDESLLFWRENTPKNYPLPRVSSVLGFRHGVLFVAFEDDGGLFLSVKFGSGTIADGEENAD